MKRHLQKFFWTTSTDLEPVYEKSLVLNSSDVASLLYMQKLTDLDKSTFLKYLQQRSVEETSDYISRDMFPQEINIITWNHLFEVYKIEDCRVEKSEVPWFLRFVGKNGFEIDFRAKKDILELNEIGKEKPVSLAITNKDYNKPYMAIIGALEYIDAQFQNSSVYTEWKLIKPFRYYFKGLTNCIAFNPIIEPVAGKENVELEHDGVTVDQPKWLNSFYYSYLINYLNSTRRVVNRQQRTSMYYEKDFV